MSELNFPKLRRGLKRHTYPPTVAFDFSGAPHDHWSDAVSANCEQSVDTVHIHEHSQALKIRKTGNSWIDFSQYCRGTGGELGPLNLENHFGLFYWYAWPGLIHEPDFSDGASNTRFLGVGGGWQLYIHEGGTNEQITIYTPNTSNADGWIVTPFRLSDMAGAVDPTNIDRLQLRFSPADFSDYQANHIAATCARLEFYPRHKARVLFRLDDGFDDTYQWANEAASHGFRIISGIIGQNVNGSVQMTIDQIRELDAAGHSMLNHWDGILSDREGDLGGSRWTDSNIDTENTNANRETSIVACMQKLQRWRVGRHSDITVTPGGANHPGDPDLINRGVCRMFHHGGAVQPGINGTTPVSWPRGKHEYYLWTSYQIDGMATDTGGPGEEVKAALDVLCTKGGDAVFYGHSNSSDYAAWQIVCAYVETLVTAGLLEVIVQDDLTYPLPIVESPRTMRPPVILLNADTTVPKTTTGEQLVAGTWKLTLDTADASASIAFNERHIDDTNWQPVADRSGNAVALTTTAPHVVLEVGEEQEIQVARTGGSGAVTVRAYLVHESNPL